MKYYSYSVLYNNGWCILQIYITCMVAVIAKMYALTNKTMQVLNTTAH